MPNHRPLTADDVLEDITFELAQGMLARDDVATAIESVRRHQEQLRASLVNADQPADLRRIALKQFQLNDMLLAVVRELALTVRGVQLDVRRVVALPPRAAEPAEAEPSHATPAPPSPPPPLQVVPVQAAPATAMTLPALPDPPALGAVRAVLDAPASAVSIVVRPVGIPLIGKWLTRLRGAIHNLPIFYVNRLAQEQTAVNQTLADAVLRLSEESRRQRAVLAALTRDRVSPPDGE